MATPSTVGRSGVTTLPFPSGTAKATRVPSWTGFPAASSTVAVRTAWLAPSAGSVAGSAETRIEAAAGAAANCTCTVFWVPPA